ncbi:MAG: (d)CMP kinase [Clostridiales bacterium]|jgi:cytidylate kinase|nr:(d)CMP kinase [Clostridiales bacterium]
MYQVAIDGPGGSGKSTIAGLCAKKLDFKHIDTGAMYRAFAYYCIQEGCDILSKKSVDEALKNAKITLEFIDGVQHTFVNGEDVSDKIRTQEIGESASKVSELMNVRLELAKNQRTFGERENIIMDGRDIGTVVLPNATVKIFLTADEGIRAERRVKELKEKGIVAEFSDVLKQNKIRDDRDTSRAFAPLKVAPDALVINTNDLDIKAVCDIVIRLIKQKIAAKEGKI